MNDDSPCYTLADGSCISPFKCVHGWPMPLEDFLRLASDADCLKHAETWYLNHPLRTFDKDNPTKTANE